MSNILKLGVKAPNFILPDKDNNQVSLNEVTSTFKVVYFYPKDNTPGCTIQAKQFSKDLNKIRALDAEVIGISGGDEKSKTLFCKKNKLALTLLSDTDFSIAKEYGVFGEKFFMGRKYLGISRVTYLLDKANRVIKVFEKASPETNSGEIISHLQQIQNPIEDSPKAKTTKKKVTRLQKTTKRPRGKSA